MRHDRSWTSRLGEIKEICDAGKATFFWTSNFSIGVNIFFALNRYLAAFMAGFPQYRPTMKEIHHIHKLDHPSGTALTLAEGIMDSDQRIGCWSEQISDDHTLLIDHEREGEVPGTHIIRWDSPVDTITIEHRAKSREGFALGRRRSRRMGKRPQRIPDHAAAHGGDDQQSSTDEDSRTLNPHLKHLTIQSNGQK